MKLQRLLIDLKDFIDEFATTINDETRRIELESIYANLTEYHKNLTDPPQLTTGTTKKSTKRAVSDVEEVFYKEEFSARIKLVLVKLTNLLNFNIMQSEFLLSETSVKRLQGKMLLLLKGAREVEIQPPPEIEIDREDALKLYEKYPNTISLLLKVLDPNDEVLTELLKIKAYFGDQLPTDVLELPDRELSGEYYQNMIQTYSLYREGVPRAFAKILEDDFQISGAKFTDIRKIAARIGGILVLMRVTNVEYRTYLFDNYKAKQSGVTPEFMENSTTIARVNSVKQGSCTFYSRDGKVIDVLKLRCAAQLAKVLDSGVMQHSEIARKMVMETVLIIESIDNGTKFIKMRTNPRHLFHLYNGPNQICAAENNLVNKNIDNFYVGPKLIVYKPTGTPIEYIRDNIKRAITKVYERKKIKTCEAIDEFILSDDMRDAYTSVLFESIIEHISKSTSSKIVAQESLLSTISDIEFRYKKYQQALSAGYSKERKKMLELKSGTQIQDALVAIITGAIKYSISEKDNVFKILEEKRFLFM